MGPLQGVKILEIGSIGPGPFTGMLLANLGADVIRVRRPGETNPLGIAGPSPEHTGRPDVAVDLKTPHGRDFVRTLAGSADALIEGFRPGVMERLGLGPEDLLARNPALVYGRITGYGQDGPMAGVPGHDINYVAMSGVLGAISRSGERPLAPLNLLADYGGGGMLLALGVVCGVLEARGSGKGQVVDAAMVDGVAQMATVIFALAEAGRWGAPGTNVLDSGAHFYDVYETSDRGFVAVGALEPQFYAALLDLLELPAEQFPQWDQPRWGEFRGQFAKVFATRTRAEWTALALPGNACVTPVLSMAETPSTAHSVHRSGFGADGLPRSAPRFSRSGSADQGECRAVSPAQALTAWGVSPAVIDELWASGALG